jgi:hypothetical protein
MAVSMVTREDLDQLLRDLSEEDQNWIFRQLVDRFWPQLAGMKVVLVEATGFYSGDDGWTNEDSECYRRKAEAVERDRKEGF